MYRRIGTVVAAAVPPGLGAAIAVALMLSLSGAALAAAATNVVPPTGKVAGHGSGYWLQRSWQLLYSSSAPVAPCQTLTSNGQRVGYLTQMFASGTQKITCNEPAGRPLFLIAASSECSTFKGDHPGFGTSDAQLKRCARVLFRPPKATLTLDGHRVDLNTLIAATGVFRVHFVKNNVFGAPPGNARSAACGPILLLTGLGTGTHVIRLAGPSPTYEVTWTVHVG